MYKAEDLSRQKVFFVGDKLISVDGKDLIVETHDIEQCEKPM